MSQPTVLVYDPDTGEWVTPEEYQKRLERRKVAQDVRALLVSAMASLLQGAVISFTLTGTVCGTTVTLSGTGVIAAVGAGRPGGGGPGGRGP
jgi:integral membrane sensor domain MASE1